MWLFRNLIIGDLEMKNVLARLSSILLITAFAGFGSVQAATIDTLFNTGVDSSGAVLTSGSDPHYTLTYNGSTLDTMVLSGTDFPLTHWLNDATSDSAWIKPDTERGNDSPGIYTFSTAFDLTGFDPTTAYISGKWSTDNSGVDILLNGVSLGLTAGGFENWYDFVIDSGFIAGINTLDFVVKNNSGSSGNPVGLRVDMAGTATVVPVPAAVWLFGSGLLGLVGYSRRKTA
jgi:hypothetical protein